MIFFLLRYVLLWGAIYFVALCGLHFVVGHHSFFGQYDRDLATALVGCLCYVTGFRSMFLDALDEPGPAILKFVFCFAVIEIGRYCIFGHSEMLGYYLWENSIVAGVAYISGVFLGCAWTDKVGDGSI